MMENIIKKLLLYVVFSTTISLNVSSQGYYHIVSKGTSQPYSITGNGSVYNIISGTSTPQSSILSNGLTIPFDFNFYGVTYNTFKVSTSGYLTFDLNQTTDNFANTGLPAILAPKKSIFAFWDNLRLQNINFSSSSIRSWTLGTSPSRIHVIQWSLLQTNDTTNGVNVTSFAIRLYESDNHFDIVHNFGFGNFSATVGCQNGNGTLGSQIGSSPNQNFGGKNGSYDASLSDVYSFYYGSQPNIWMRSITNLTQEIASTNSTIGTPISVKYANWGAQQFNSANLRYTVNNGPTVTQSITQSIPPSGGIGTISTLPATNYRPSAIEEGTFKTIRAWLSNINGTNNNSDTIQFTIFVNRGIRGNKRTLLEVFEGAWVGQIPDGKLYVDSLQSAYGDSIIVVSHHSNDGMSNNSSDVIQNAFAPFFPSAAIDRVSFPNESKVAVGRNLWRNYASTQLASETPVNISIINKTFNPITRVIDYDVKVDFIDYPFPGNIKLNAFIVEDGVRGPMLSATSTTWNQRNIYGTDPTHPFYNFPQYIFGYKHDNVVRGILSGPWGNSYLIPNNPQIGTSYIQHFTYTLAQVDSVFQSSYNGQNEISNQYQNTFAGPAKNKQENIRLVAFLSYDSTDITKRKIINSTQSQLIDNVSYVTDTLVCKGKTITFNLGKHKLYLGNSYLGNTVCNLRIDTTTTFTVKDLLGNNIKSIKVTVVDSLNIQSIFTNDTISICGFNNKFVLGTTTNHIGQKTYKWFRNDTLLTNVSRIDSFVNSGIYKTIVTTSSGCIQNKIFYNIHFLHDLLHVQQGKVEQIRKLMKKKVVK